MTITTTSAEETKHVAAEFAATLHGGETVLLEGDLGAGKTTFVQGLVEALGGHAAHSPTFSIMNVYEIGRQASRPPGRKDEHEVLRASGPVGLSGLKNIVHLDLYRLKHANEIRELGLEEWLGKKNAIVLVEWPEAVAGIDWGHAIRVRCELISPNERSISISPVLL